jgi:transketolase
MIEREWPLLKANLDEFSDILTALAKQNRNILAVTSDSRGSGKLVSFAEILPDQIVEVGIAEQNLVGVAAGLASSGKKVFAVSPGSFLTTRALEQIKNDVAYSNQPVVLVGISSGVSYGALGSTHHSLHDIAALRAINNITIVIPSDAFETRHAVILASKADRPVFLRFGKKPMPLLPRIDCSFQFGKAAVICEGSDINFIATGEAVAPSYNAAILLKEKGISAGVISMHTIRPLDEGAICNAASRSTAVITVEEHSIYGGLGEACAAVLMQKGIQVRFSIVGIPDEDTVTGSQTEIFNHYGISAPGLVEKALIILNKQ